MMKATDAHTHAQTYVHWKADEVVSEQSGARCTRLKFFKVVQRSCPLCPASAQRIHAISETRGPRNVPATRRHPQLLEW
jgi:hypothetical protein